MAQRSITFGYGVWAGASGNLASNWIIGYVENIDTAGVVSFVGWIYGTPSSASEVEFDTSLGILGVTDSAAGSGGTLSGSLNTGAVNMINGAPYLLTGRLNSTGNFVDAAYLTVSGLGSSLTAENIDVGFVAPDSNDFYGTLVVADGGAVAAGGSIVISDSTITVSGTNSKLTSEELDVGESGYFGGLLTISNGGAVSVSGDVYDGDSPYGSSSTITVSGAGSTLTSEGLFVGVDASYPYGAGAGTLTVADGGIVSVSGIVNVGDYNSAAPFEGNGTVILADGTLNASELILNSSLYGKNELSGYGTVNGNIENLGTIFANGGTLTLTGNVTGNEEIGLGISELVLNSTVSGGITFDSAPNNEGFNGGVLSIGDLGNFGATIYNFLPGDTIDLTGVRFPSATSISGLEANFNATTGILSIDDVNFGGPGQLYVSQLLGSLQFYGLPATQTFKLLSDGNGGTKIVSGVPAPDLLTLADMDEYTYMDATYSGPLPNQTFDGYTLVDGTSDNAGMLADVFEDGNQLVIAFRGTDPTHLYETIKTLLADTSWAAGTLGLPSGNPNSILDQEVTDAALFLEQVRQQYPDETITLTGHSLGGAIAQLLGNSSGYTAVGFNAPGAQQFEVPLAGALEPAVNTGDGVSGRTNVNFRLQGDQVSLAGTPIGAGTPVDTVYTLPTLPAFSAGGWLNALSNHSMDTIVQVIAGATATTTIDGISGVPTSVIGGEPDSPLPLSGLIQPTSTVLDDATDVLGLKFTVGVIAAVGASLAAISAAFYAIDPDGASSYQLVGDASSPEISGFSLPSYSSIATYNVSLLVNGTWQATQSVTPDEIIQAPAGVTGIQYSALDANGNPVLLPDGYIIDVAFASAGTFNGTLSEGLAGLKYWTGNGWILQDGSATTAPGATDTAILGGTLTGFVLPQSGTVSFAGLTPVTIGSLEASGAGPWTITGTGGVGDAIDNLVVPVGSSIFVDTTIAVKNLTVTPAIGVVTPASIVLVNGLPPGAEIDFPGQTVTFTSTSLDNLTDITAKVGNTVVAYIALNGDVAFSGAPTSDGSGGTELTVTGTEPFTNPSYIILNVGSANDINRPTDENLLIGDQEVLPNGYQGTTITATSTTNSATGLPYSVVSVPFAGSPAIPDLYGKSVVYDPTNPADAYEIQPWTLSYVNGTQTESSITPSLFGVTPPPFAANVTFSGSSTNPAFTWSYPAGSVTGVFFDIYDDTDLTASGSADFVFSTTIVGTSGSFTVPSALDGGLTLLQGHHYTLDLYGVTAINPSQPLSNGNSKAWSQSYFDFETETGITAANVYLPTITATGAYQFNVTVVAGQTYFIDPAIASGYSYVTAPGNPNFASVLLPAIQTTSYLVTFTTNGKQVTDTVAPNTVFNFPAGGVSAFTVTRIAAADNLNPADATAFVTGLTFVSSGAFTGTQTPLIDSGPTAGAVTSSVTLGQSIDLTSVILAQVAPGLIGDTETLTAAGPTSEGGQVKLINGDLTYAGQSAILNNIPANGSLTDTFTYTVTDELGDSATGTVKVTVSNPAKIINGTEFGFDVIKGGAQTNIVNANGSFNTIYESGGNDVVNAGDGFGTVFTGTGDVVVNLKGYINDVVGGNGNDTINILSGGFDQITLGSGNDAITTASNGLGFDTFVLTGSDASALLYGSGNTVFIHGGTDTVTDDSQGLRLKIGSEGGSISLSNFLADRSGLIDLTGGIGGFKNVHALVAALQSDGHGGTLLPLGASGHIDFVGVAPSALTASRFQIG